MANSLHEYKLQLQQVEAALLIEPNKDELLQLKNDLIEIISLSKDLGQFDDNSTKKITPKVWKEGDQCMAKPNLSTAYYECTIVSITDDIANVKFLPSILKKFGWNSSIEQQVNVSELRKVEYSKHLQEKLKNKAEKKKLKKRARLEEIEQHRENEKNKWLQFQSKNNVKHSLRTKSIFASPDSVEGRIGIGTCGISGRPMTEFVSNEKPLTKKSKKLPRAS